MILKLSQTLSLEDQPKMRVRLVDVSEANESVPNFGRATCRGRLLLVTLQFLFNTKYTKYV